MSHTPIDYYQSFDNVRSEAESPANLQDSRLGASYSVARLDGLPQPNEYLTSGNAIPTSENDQMMQSSRMMNVDVDSKANINTALAVAMIHGNGEMIDGNQLTGMMDNQNSAAAAAAAAAAVAAASSSVQPQIHPNALQSLAKPMPLRNNQPPPCSEALLQHQQRAYTQQTIANAPPQLQTPMGVIPSLHGAGPSSSPPDHNSIQMANQIAQSAGMDNHNVHGVIDDVSMQGASNQVVANNNGNPIISPSSMPTSVIKVLSGSQQQRPRSEKKPIPEDMKDDKYFERRKRNNMAAKKSRDARKQREDEIAIRASFLEKENAILRAQVATLRDEANSLRQLLLAKRTNRT